VLLKMASVLGAFFLHFCFKHYTPVPSGQPPPVITRFIITYKLSNSLWYIALRHV